MITTVNQTAPIPGSHSEGFEKGRRFEQFIIELFNEQFFTVKTWRKSERFPDHFPLIDCSFPDIEMELVFTGAKKYRFAVECKWRATFRNGKIKWAEDRQICAYRKFQDQVRIPVFVAIGIGGEPDKPDKLFLTPLNNIHMHEELYESDLIPFKRKPTHKLYYDYQQLLLF